MRSVYIAGAGQTDIGELWDRSLRDLAVEAAFKAFTDAGRRGADCVIVGNMLSGELAAQENLAALVADSAGLLPVEAVKVEAACGSGGIRATIAPPTETGTTFVGGDPAGPTSASPGWTPSKTASPFAATVCVTGDRTTTPDDASRWRIEAVTDVPGVPMTRSRPALVTPAIVQQASVTDVAPSSAVTRNR